MKKKKGPKPVDATIATLRALFPDSHTQPAICLQHAECEFVMCTHKKPHAPEHTCVTPCNARGGTCFMMDLMDEFKVAFDL